jgi:two-component system NarL family sensor kinase
LHVSQGIAGAAVRTHMAQVVNDVTQDPRYVPPPLPIDVTAELAVPIVLGHEVFGVVNIEGRAAFDREDISSIQVIADHLAVAIKNARLFDDARAAAVMRERQRLARDLHDSVTQVLSSISLMSQSIIAAYRKDAQEGERRARRIKELSQLAFAEMRRMLNELRPVATGGNPGTRAGALAEIESYGLKRALQSLLAVLAPETADVHFDFANYRFQALEHEEALYRICQEAVSNSLRHGNARRITIRAEVVDARRIRVEVADDGQGFDATEPTVLVHTALGGLGMQTMRERAIALGGTTTIHSKPGQGTRVLVDLPRSDR